MRKGNRGLPEQADLNVTNLVDVALTLLIIFIITAPLIEGSLDINVPKTQAERREIFEGVMVVIDEKGDLFLGNERVADKDFQPRLARLMKDDPLRPVYLKADEAVGYGKVVDVISGIKETGVTNLGLVVKPATEKEGGG